jgi:hypothetical protein
MFRLFPSNHQGACYMVQRKNNVYIFQDTVFKLVFFSLNVPFVKIINKILKTFCCLPSLCVVVFEEETSEMLHLEHGFVWC